MSSTMTVTHVQPRRRAARDAEEQAGPSQSLSDTNPDLSVRKGSTFHQPKSPSSSTQDPVISFKSLPPRSLTSPKALEDLVVATDKRVEDIISSFGYSLSGLGADNVETTYAGQDKLPIAPSLVAHAASKTKLMETESRQGSAADANARTVTTSVYKPLEKPSLPSRADHVLSEFAAKVIKLHIIDPIIEESTLKEFHPLVRGLPHRIASHQIRCLRDLEKVLIFLAPQTAKSVASYLDFCESSIQCIHTTVDHLNDLDLRRPTDRPYTNSYFVDLVEQVRHYARIMANSRQKKSEGLPMDDSDIQPGEKILLRGGVAEGKPVELVRERDGKFIPIDAGQLELDDDMLDDDVSRSMARKRKCDIGKVEYRACRECGKVYTRPCDLTKHEKTHSRPWKCSDPGCKYFEFGWPTEKERDRHVNDKHSSAPALYYCLWKDSGCAYTSKRESNCKQHMEKAHGWDYIRSKSKKGTKLVPSAASPGAMLMPTPGSERLSTPALTASSMQSPAPSSHDGFSPAESSNYSAFGSARGSISSFQPTPYAPSPSDSEAIFSFNDYSKEYNYADFMSPTASDGRQESVAPPPAPADLTLPPQAHSEMSTSTFEADFNFGNLNYNWSSLGNVFPQYNIPQQPTPIGSDYGFDFELQPSTSNEQSLVTGPSPAASNAMLFTEDVMMQESQGFADFAAQSKPGLLQHQQSSIPGDFTLFGEIQGSQAGAVDTAAAMFPDLDVGAGQFDQEMSAGMFDQMSEEEMDRYLYGDGTGN